MSSVLISGLRSPTNTWKWSKAQEKPKQTNKKNDYNEKVLTKTNSEISNLILTGCVFFLAARRGGPIYFDLLTARRQQRELETMTQVQVNPGNNSSGQMSTKATHWGDFTQNQMVLPFLISSSCSWSQEPKQRLCDQRTPQSNKDRCLYALKTIKNRSKLHHPRSNWFSGNHSTSTCLSIIYLVYSTYLVLEIKQ